MASVCFYFQLHQPHRLRRYSVFDTDARYFDDQRNAQILHKVANKCYLPATQLILDLVKRHEGKFRVAYSVTGSIIDQFRMHCPEMISLLQKLATSGCVEFLNETYHHSLAFLYSRDEFRAQIDLHAKLVKDLFGQVPRVFRNTELIYSNELAHYIAGLGRFDGLLAEGADQILGYRSPNYLYRPEGEKSLKLMLKNYRLSDDIAFRFSNRGWPEWPLTADKFARWINQINGDGYVCNLFMDYETFGEHQWADTGIFDFLAALPAEVLKTPGNDFKTPSECIKAYEPVGSFDAPHMISWADTERDLSAWLGNAMQSNALHELYRLEAPIKARGDAKLLEDWRRLTTSDHFYYMCTKYFADGDVHKYFNPYESPYDSYINFMNVMDSLRTRTEAGR
ncbi:MAG: glycoside hydrolase family 57 protein [Planctomycetota bacterium]|nr:glycoside hydrolase family 57 protein [Planctomycetota bacterium]